jgi:hypothetical protein
MAQPALDVWKVLRNMTGTQQGLAPILIDPGVGEAKKKKTKKKAKVGDELSSTAHFTTNHITLGARGDSYYEYMLKQYLVGGKKDEKLLVMYVESMRGVRDLLLAQTKPGVRSIWHACV